MSTSSNDIITVSNCPRVVVSSDSQVDVSHLSQEDFNVRMLEGRPYASPVLANKREFSRNGVICDAHQYVVFDPQPFSGDEYATAVATGVKTPPATPTGAAPPALMASSDYQTALHNFSNIGYPVSSSPFLLKVASTRATLHFNPKTTVVGIVTCGGLCPGLNDVIRSLTLSAHGSYQVKRVLGFRYGYWGLSAEGRHTAVELTPENVSMIHRQGGTMLGSSRGGQPINEMVDTLQHYGVNILFTAGGDGTQKGSLAIEEECRRRGLDIAIVGIPKTIDSDISISHRTFGYETAVEESVRAIRAAHAEASSHEYGIGVVTLMGRHSGFIAAQATIASAQANICLIPEVKTSKETFLKLLETRFKSRKYCVVVVAEGFGQDWEECKGDHGVDASGNKKNANIGEIVKDVCNKFLKSDKKYKLSTVKYIDPSYMIRACPANPSDSAFCTRLSSLAVHEAMAGNTGCVISHWFGNFVLVPTRVCVSTTRKVSPLGHLWRQVRDLTVDNDVHVTYDIELHEGSAAASSAAGGEATSTTLLSTHTAVAAVSAEVKSPNTAQVISMTNNSDFVFNSAASSSSPRLTPPPEAIQGDVPRQRIIVIREPSVVLLPNGNTTTIAPNAAINQSAASFVGVPSSAIAASSPSFSAAIPHRSGGESFGQHALRAVSTGIVTAAIILGAIRLGAVKK